MTESHIDIKELLEQKEDLSNLLAERGICDGAKVGVICDTKASLFMLVGTYNGVVPITNSDSSETAIDFSESTYVIDDDYTFKKGKGVGIFRLPTDTGTNYMHIYPNAETFIEGIRAESDKRDWKPYVLELVLHGFTAEKSIWK